MSAGAAERRRGELQGGHWHEHGKELSNLQADGGATYRSLDILLALMSFFKVFVVRPLDDLWIVEDGVVWDGRVHGHEKQRRGFSD